MGAVTAWDHLFDEEGLTGPSDPKEPDVKSAVEAIHQRLSTPEGMEALRRAAEESARKREAMVESLRIDPEFLKRRVTGPIWNDSERAAIRALERLRSRRVGGV